MTEAGMDHDQLMLVYAGGALLQAGVEVEPYRTATGWGLTNQAGQFHWDLQELTEQAATLPADQQRAFVVEQAARMAQTLSRPAEPLTAEMVRACVRTRVVTEQQATQLSYARPIAPGLWLALAIETDTSVWTLPVVPIPEVSELGVDELFALGQSHSDQVSNHEVFEVDRDIIAITAQSPFLAAQIANFAVLLEKFGTARHGIAFGVLARNLVIGTALAGDASVMNQVLAVAQRIDSLAHDPEVGFDGGLLSAATYYWAPDGRIELLGGTPDGVRGLPTADDDVATLTVRPGDAFNEWVIDHLLRPDADAGSDPAQVDW